MASFGVGSANECGLSYKKREHVNGMVFEHSDSTDYAFSGVALIPFYSV